EWLKHHGIEVLARVQGAIAVRLQAEQEAVELLQTIPSVKATAAATIIAELGTDMSRFPSAKHLARLRWGLPWEQAERRHPPHACDSQREPLSAGRGSRSGLEYDAHRDLPGRSVSPPGTQKRETASGDGGGPSSVGDHLACLEAEEAV